MGRLRVYESVDDALAFARFAYYKIEDKAGIDYLAHPVRVMETVKRRGGVPYMQVGALLHDVVEDTVITAQMLLDLGFHEDAVEVIVLLTRDPHTSPDCRPRNLCDGCYAYYAAIKKHPGAKIIKDADMEDNSDPSRLQYLPPKKVLRLVEKYTEGRELIA